MISVMGGNDNFTDGRRGIMGIDDLTDGRSSASMISLMGDHQLR